VLDLVMKVTVSPVVEVLPTESPRIALKIDEVTTQRLRLRPRLRDQVEVTAVACSVPYAHAALEGERDEAGRREYDLALTIDPQAPLGQSNFVVTLSTTAKDDPQVPITVRCEKGIAISPASFDFGLLATANGKPVTRSVLLRQSGANFHLRNVTSTDPRLETRLQTLKEGAAYRLTATYQDGVPEDLASAVVTIETDNPQQPTLEIPVRSSPVRNRPNASPRRSGSGDSASTSP
jgi:hypothetical protein